MDYFYDYFMVLLWCLRFPVCERKKIQGRNIKMTDFSFNYQQYFLTCLHVFTLFFALCFVFCSVRLVYPLRLIRSIFKGEFTLKNCGLKYSKCVSLQIQFHVCVIDRFSLIYYVILHMFKMMVCYTMQCIPRLKHCQLCIHQKRSLLRKTYANAKISHCHVCFKRSLITAHEKNRTHAQNQTKLSWS